MGHGEIAFATLKNWKILLIHPRIAQGLDESVSWQTTLRSQFESPPALPLAFQGISNNRLLQVHQNPEGGDAQ